MKITTEQTERIVTLKIEGRVANSLNAEFLRAWKELAPSLGSRKLVVDLRDVTFMDRTGRNLLAEIHAKTGAEFLADTPMTKYFAEEAMQSAQTDLR